MSNSSEPIYAFLKDCAERGAPAPTTNEIAEAVGMDNYLINYWMKKIVAAGLIEISKGRSTRIITIRATGKSTAEGDTRPRPPKKEVTMLRPPDDARRIAFDGFPCPRCGAARQCEHREAA